MDVVVGMGEIGAPLANLLSVKYPVVRRDCSPVGTKANPTEVMHICFPYSDSFRVAVVDYIEEYGSELTVIHSTVPPGTTREIDGLSKGNVVYSPVRGRHHYMRSDMIKYIKFFAAPDLAVAKTAAAHFEEVSIFQTKVVPFVEALELAKLTETTYSALLIAWAQEMERFCVELGVEREILLDFTKEVEYLPRHAFHPGYIGGHCIMPNLDLLERIRPLPLVDAIRRSNDACTEAQKADGRRYRPIGL